jgi:KDEL-tailed cysteine endopeptidase
MKRPSTVMSAVVLLAFAISSRAVAQTSLPASVDWRTHGAVTPVRNMGQCGASWAFAAVAAVEGVTAIHSGKLHSLSEQELIDCTGVEGNHGCSGGSAEGAFHWIARHGITSEAQYPYTARDRQCRLGSPVVARLTGFQHVATDVRSLMTAVAKQPVAVLIDGSADDFHQYGGGLYPCHSGTPNVWVTIVGYGVDASKRAYWIVKGSWGTEWGEHGYMRMTRSDDCANIGTALVPTM